MGKVNTFITPWCLHTIVGGSMSQCCYKSASFIPFQVPFLYLVHSPRVSMVANINNLLPVGGVFPAFKTAVVSPHLGEPSQEPEILGNHGPVSKHILFCCRQFWSATDLQEQLLKNWLSPPNVPLQILYRNNDFQCFKLLFIPQIKPLIIPTYSPWVPHGAMWVVMFLAGTSQCLHLCLAPHETKFAYKQADTISEFRNDGSWTIFILPRGPANALGRFLLRSLLLVICFPWTTYSC